MEPWFDDVQIPPDELFFASKHRLFLKNIHSSVGNERHCLCIVSISIFELTKYAVIQSYQNMGKIRNIDAGVYVVSLSY